MTRLEDRQTLMRDIAQACAEGARLAPACALAGIAARTLQRWKIDGLTRGDRRPDADRPAPPHALSEAERARIIEVANEPRFAATRRRGSFRHWPTKGSTSPASQVSTACCARMAR
jgi:putative transposase